jgi:acyl carrier protein
MKPATGHQLEADLLAVVRQTFLDLHRQPDRVVRIAPDSSLDRDLGFDSLARVELLLRIERRFDVMLPENTLQSAETPRDLLLALHGAHARAGRTVPDLARVAPMVFADDAETEPRDATTLLEALDWHVRAHAERTQIVFLSDAGEQNISYGGLASEALAVAAGLQSAGLGPGQTVAIMLPTSADYFYAYFGILRAGGIPVPIYPPARLSQLEEHVRRHAGILANAQAALLITIPEAMAVARLLEANVPGLRKVTTIAALTKQRGDAVAVPVRADDIAFIQYTSGSTGNPKGVVLTHRNLLANIHAIGDAAEISQHDVFVSWLPLYHDMGLISGWLASLHFGYPFVVMSPLAFLARPERWLQAIHRYRGTLTAAPNFAYELCLKRIDDAAIQGIDLGSLRIAANGAEPVSPDTLERFIERFGKYGFRREAMVPVYGLAEATVGLLCPPLHRGPLIDRIRREPFVLRQKALPAGPDDPNPLRFAACGRPLPGHQVRIVDETGREVGERVEGVLEFKGPSATGGYYLNPEQTRLLFHGEWLDTGDRAYIAEGEVYVSGRVKDIIIRGGRNIYPHELEEAVGALPGVRKGCVAVFGSPDPAAGTERLVVLAETRETGTVANDDLREAISRVAMDVLGEPPDEVVLAPPHTVLKTSSGKLRRSACRELYEKGLVGARSRSVWWQMARLVWTALLPQARRWLAVAGEYAYAAHVCALFWVIAPLAWLLTALMPRPRWAWAVGHLAARAFLRLAGMPFLVRGLENLPRGRPNVLVANHASYLDGIILAAALPAAYRFVAKQELRAQFVPRVYLERLGAEFVERFAAQQSVDDMKRISGVLAAGNSLAFFPEGTFSRIPGLLPFRLGAFAAAAAAGVPVVPVAIRGSRAVLRDGHWFPRRGTLVVTIGDPIPTPTPAAAQAQDGFSVAVEMRDLARAEILRHCGEPDAATGSNGARNRND